MIQAAIQSENVTSYKMIKNKYTKYEFARLEINIKGGSSLDFSFKDDCQLLELYYSLKDFIESNNIEV